MVISCRLQVLEHAGAAELLGGRNGCVHEFQQQRSGNPNEQEGEGALASHLVWLLVIFPCIPFHGSLQEEVFRKLYGTGFVTAKNPSAPSRQVSASHELFAHTLLSVHCVTSSDRVGRDGALGFFAVTKPVPYNFLNTSSCNKP